MCDVLVESVAGYNGDTSLPELVQVLVLKKRTITLLKKKNLNCKRCMIILLFWGPGLGVKKAKVNFWISKIITKINEEFEVLFVQLPYNFYFFAYMVLPTRAYCFVIIFVLYAICRHSDRLVGRPLAEIRTRTRYRGRNTANYSSTTRPPHLQN